MDLKSCLDDLTAEVVWDEALARRLYQFRVRYVTQNREHMEFFGGNLFGVNRVRFTDTDRNRLLETMDLDYDSLSSSIKQVTDIAQQYKVAGDPLNLLLMYVLHRWTISKLPSKVKQQAKMDTALIFFQRCIAILISAWVKHPMDPKVVQQAYSNLSKKFLIKELGSWNKVMDYRAKALIHDRDSPHVKTFERFDDGVSVQYAISDSQNRIKGLVKGYYAEIMLVHEEGGGVAISRATQIDEEGEEGLRVKTVAPENYVYLMRQILPDPQTFVLEENLKIVSKSNTNTSMRAVRGVLEWMSVNTSDPKYHKLIDDFVTLTVVQGVYFLNNNIETEKQRDLVYVMTQLKNLFLSTRSVDPDLLRIRELGEEIVTLSQGKLSSSLMMATRTAVLMYICLRFLTGRKSK